MKKLIVSLILTVFLLILLLSTGFTVVIDSSRYVFYPSFFAFVIGLLTLINIIVISIEICTRYKSKLEKQQTIISPISMKTDNLSYQNYNLTNYPSYAEWYKTNQGNIR